MNFPADSKHVHDVIASPNHGERKNGAIDLLILHYTGMANGQVALERLCEPAAQVSAHYLVFEDGRIVQLVPESRRAWHAGLGCWKGERDVNSRSIGIEIVHPGHIGGLPPYPPEQIEAVIALSKDVVDRHAIPAERVLAHSDVAPERKEDPGENFPWDGFAKAGVGHLVRPTPIRDGRFFALGDAGEPIKALQEMFSLYGYDQPVTGLFDLRTQAVVTAFQRHFRQASVDGVADASTITTLRDLIAAQPKV